MDITKEAREYRERCKEIFTDEDFTCDSAFGSYFYQWYVRDKIQDEKELETLEFKMKHLELKGTFNIGWEFSKRKYYNAFAADMLDVRDCVRSSIHKLRELKKQSKNADAIKAYNDSLNIIKEVLEKIPNRLIRL